MNERITEDIVREHFKKNIIPGMKIEEQKSSNARINKLLQGASKKGNGAGKPEFIITFEGKDFIIVVECKADKLDRKSVV